MNNENDVENSIKITDALIDRAILGEHLNQERLNTFDEYRAAKTVLKATSKITTGFLKTAKDFFKDYTKNLKNNIDSVQSLIWYRKMQDCYDYYSKECEILQDSIDEYEEYMMSGNIVRSLLGHNRRDDE